MRAGPHADSNHSLVVKGFHSGGEFGGGFEKGIDHAGRGLFGALADNLLYPPASEKFSLAIARVQNSVAEKHEHVSGLHAEMEFIVFRLVEQTQWQAGGFDHFVLAAVDEDGAGKAGVRN